MKKCGLVTFTCSNNFGAVLQNYALESWIRENCPDIDVETVNYESPVTRNHYSAKLRVPACSSIGDAVKFVPRLCRRLYFLKYIRGRNEIFAEFRKKYLKLSRRYLDKSDLQNASFEYDFLMTGSDQVLNSSITKDNWDVYSLALFDGCCRKLGYAVSAGSVENLTPDIISSLREFEVLSARETDLAEILSQKLNIKVQHVIDPVFLKTKKEWESLAKSAVKKWGGDYIFIYSANRQACDFAKKLARKEHLKIVSADYCMPFIEGRVYAGDLGPAEFIDYLKNAKYVVTSSFHATAFSIIFHKKLFCFGDVGRNRINSIMGSLGLSGLVFSSVADVDMDACLVEWDNVDAKLSTLRDESSAWLKSALSD